MPPCNWREEPARDRADDPEDAGVEERADRAGCAADQRDERRRGHVDERRRRPAEEDEGGDGEDEAERDAVRVGALDRDREALGQGRGDEERADPGDRRRRARVARTKENVAARYAATPTRETGATTASSLAGGSARPLISASGRYQVKLSSAQVKLPSERRESDEQGDHERWP